MTEGRFKREYKTIAAMTGIYCRDHHGGGAGEKLCGECRELLEYAGQRLEKCPYGQGKPVCAKCPIHCYRPEMRERVQQVMRYAGPRMLKRHLIMAVRHLLDSRKKALRKKR